MFFLFNLKFRSVFDCLLLSHFISTLQKNRITLPRGKLQQPQEQRYPVLPVPVFSFCHLTDEIYSFCQGSRGSIPDYSSISNGHGIFYVRCQQPESDHVLGQPLNPTPPSPPPHTPSSPLQHTHHNHFVILCRAIWNLSSIGAVTKF